MEATTAKVLDGIASMKIEQVAITSVIPYDNNAKKHTEAGISKLAGIIKKVGFNQPIVIDENGVILTGHRRRLAALHPILNLHVVPVIRKFGLTEAEKMAWRVADNRVSEDSELDTDALQKEILKLKGLGLEDLEQLNEALAFEGDELAQLDIDLASLAEAAPAPAKRAKGSKPGKPKISLASHFDVPPLSVIDTMAPWWAKRLKAWGEEDKSIAGGSSSLVLAELILRWYSMPQGVVCDPFNCDATVAKVAEVLGRTYTSGAASSDLLLSFVPAFAGDDFNTYVEDAKARISAAVEGLRPCRYACFVVNETRAGNGLAFYMASRMAECIEQAGLQLVDEVIVVHPPEAPVPNADFGASRLLERAHTTLLVYVKGDPAVAAQEMGPCEFGSLEASDAQSAAMDENAGLAVQA